jgi:hypothetical protein
VTRRRPYDWQADPEDAWAPLAEAMRRLRNFLASLRENGIHVGIGSPASCATCGVPWPCPHSLRQP